MADQRPMVGILYESGEWSDRKLASELRSALADAGLRWDVALIDMEQPDAIGRALCCRLLVSRVFASARFRGHGASLERMPQLVDAAEKAGIPLVNPARAHAFEVSKRAAAEALAATGFAVPAIYACGLPSELGRADLPFPCIVKPDCGGRGEWTAILRSAEEARAFLAEAPGIAFVAEEYVEPELGFLTRIEVVDGKVALVVKRSVAPNGLSGYHHGSTYAPYGDCSPGLVAEAERAAAALGFDFGSFDVIECARGAFLIDANSVSNVSEDCTELLGIDLMRAYARAIAARAAGIESKAA